MRYSSSYHINLFCLLCITIFTLSGCSSIAKGVTEAILEQEDVEGEQLCQIRGPKFQGINSIIQDEVIRSDIISGTEGIATNKVLMVHGIGKHNPGYSTRFVENLLTELNLGFTSRDYKTIYLQDEKFPGESLGILQIQRFFNHDQTQELLFYELTWSPITEDKKRMLDFDSSNAYSFRRASLNHSIKEYLNTRISDPMIYLGNGREKMLSAVIESMCWVLDGDWNDLKPETRADCPASNQEQFSELAEDDIAFVTHSLGSRIVIDALHQFQARLESLQMHSNKQNNGRYQKYEALHKSLKEKSLNIYMLSNQLPLLGLGQDPPAVQFQVDEYCQPDGENYDKRVFKNLSIVAFSDPNDVLSYALPEGFADKYIDSRLCPSVTNALVGLTEIVDLFGFGELADPVGAHGLYDQDQTVISLVVNGSNALLLEDERLQHCDWIEEVQEIL